MYNKILLIGDMVSACKVALSAMVPVIGAKKHSVYTLPTAIVSNTFGYKKVAQISTGDYVKNSIDAWKELGFEYDAVFVGYVTDKDQAKAIIDYCKELKEKGAKIFHDPIMGEKCHLYWGIGEEVADIHKRLLPLTDYTFPSWTEAAYLTGRDFSDDNSSEKEIFAIMDDLIAMGAKNIAISSCIADGRDCIGIYDYTTGKKSLLPYERIPVKIGGTGDVFSAMIIADVMNGAEFTAAVQNTINGIYTMINAEKDKEEKLRGLDLERLLE
ncbi:MAG: bifunctional hydroxymethylpyrimidine kinase/phosphomethylpyrimidine kinase [Oscillospiraceae bacterium]|nr:bifunctional hydroxymethylpyrimidine kinase/phosphomethylpyrimidine kinase [Oscillospiraceae bacterium]